MVLLGIIAGSFIYIGKNQLINFYQSLQIQNDDIGIEGLYPNFGLPLDILGLISYGFTINNEKNEPVLSPVISNLEVQNDNHVYLFTFRENLFWNNGQKFNSAF